jgi:Spy/CpxP family protein refolding chaperone
VNLKVISPELATRLFAGTSRSAWAYLFGAVVLLGTTAALCEARQIDWDTLNLSPQQETQMQRLEGNWQKTHQEVNSQIEKDTEEMKELLLTGDSQRIRQLQNRISTNKMYLMNESTDTFLKKRDILTPAQRSQLQKMLPNRQ